MRLLITTTIILCSISAKMIAQDERQEIELGGSWFPIETYGAASWEPAYSIYGSYLTPLNSWLTIAWSAEYFNHRFESNDPISDVLFADGTRTDIAIYPAFRVGNIFEFAGGIYYSKQGSIYDRYFGGSTEVFHHAGSSVHFYDHFGLEHSFSFSRTWKTRIGIFVRDQDYRDVFPFAFRVGVSYAS
jgi:hypothetical protein